jgi:hypothetical protein
MRANATLGCMSFSEPYILASGRSSRVHAIASRLWLLKPAAIPIALH